VNTLAAEHLYMWIEEWCNLTRNTILLDICCGTGTIGITLANRVKHVIGVEISADAVEDAIANAKINNVMNARFHCGKAEDVLQLITYDIPPEDDVVAVLDPPRAGICMDVIRLIRQCTNITRLVYVSCNPSGATQNVIELTRQSTRLVRGPPFRLMEARPVDLFPHTDHCELIMRFERLIVPGIQPVR